MADRVRYMLHRRAGLLPALLFTTLLLLISAISGQTVAFAKSYTITATAGKNGTILPSGKIRVDGGDNQSFAIVPDQGYLIADVKVDGRSVGQVSTYTFYNVRANHKIEATFTARTFTITATAGPGGKIDPSGEVQVKTGDNMTFTISPFQGYGIREVLVDGKSVGPVEKYTFSDVRSDHAIEASFSHQLSVRSLSIPNRSMKIGDEVTATLDVDDDGGGTYTLVSGWVGGYPLTGFRRISSISYSAIFTITEGGNSYDAGDPIPVSGVMLAMGAAQGPIYEADIIQDQDPIDAVAPRVTRMEVPSIAVGPGGTVVVDVAADGTGYTAGPGTQINGIPLDSERITFRELTMGLYELAYLVSTEDPEVGPGELQMTLILKDPAGNTGAPYSLLKENFLEIYTTLPEAVLAGPPEICEGEETALTVMLNGRAPWDLTLEDGTGTTVYNHVTTPSFSIPVAPHQTTTYRITSVTDVNGIGNVGSGEVRIEVFGITDVEIIHLKMGYSVADDPVQLEASVPGGVFSGPGVVSSSGIFYPDAAGIDGSPHAIVYTFENQGGCISRDTAMVYVVGSESALLMPAGPVCENGEPFLISVLNVAGSSGSFTLFDSSSAQVDGLQDHGDNSATIDPSLLTPGDYTIEYRYFNGDDLFLRKVFTVGTVTTPMIMGLDEGAYCQDTPGIPLQSNLEGVRFEGPGITGNVQEGYLFEARLAEPGEVSITCTYVSENGCGATAEQAVQVLAAPEVLFGLSTACIPDGGEIVSFHNLTLDKSHVVSWEWNFGDESSGKKNLSNQEDPTHFYQEPGEKTITLTATTDDGCVVSHVIDSLIDSKPSAAFSLVSDCLPLEGGVKFINRSDMGSATVDTMIWRFSTSGGALLGEVGSASLMDTVEYLFPEVNDYSIRLRAVSVGGCEDDFTKEVSLRPTRRLAVEGSLESFDQSDGEWSARSGDGMSNWMWDVPDFEGYTAEEGDRAWFTRLPVKVEGSFEQSWIESPCYDISGVQRPMIQMKLMRSFLPSVSGAVLQYLDVPEEGWKTVGEATPGINWYNSGSISGQPGGSSTGWAMEEFQPDRDWVNVGHDLDQVAGSPHVTFRLALASPGRDAMGNQGLAMDDFQIRERTKVVLLEHFTDFSQDNSLRADQIVDSLGRALFGEVIDLHYHLSYYGVDPMYEVNPDPSDTRSINYGVPEVPYSILDGGVVPEYRYPLSGMTLSSMEGRVRQLSLERPEFDISLQVDWGTDGLDAGATVTCQADRFNSNIQLYLVVFETSVIPVSAKGTSVPSRNVVLDMFPTTAGILLGDKWSAGTNITWNGTWDYRPYVEDVEDLGVAAFIQDRSTKRILQATVAYRDPTVDVPGEQELPPALAIFPNPAGELLYVRPPVTARHGARLELMDLGGTTVMMIPVSPGTDLLEIEVGRLPAGMYILRWTGPDQESAVGKVLLTR